MTQTSLGDWFPNATTNGRISEPSLTATLWRIDQDEPAEVGVQLSPDTFFVCVHLFGGMEWRADFDDRTVTAPITPQTLCIARPGERGSLAHRNAHATFMHFHLDFPRMCDLLAPDGVDLRRVDFIDPANAFDRDATAIAMRVMSAMPSGPTTRLHLDSAALALTACLLENWSDFGKRATTPRQGAAPCDWRLRRVIEFLDAHLMEDVGLTELAAIADLSPSHFTSLFRSGLGETPHRWLTRRRIARACDMLADPQISITEIALACGFSSSQHFATTFRRLAGVTPSVFRRRRLQ